MLGTQITRKISFQIECLQRESRMLREQSPTQCPTVTGTETGTSRVEKARQYHKRGRKEGKMFNSAHRNVFNKYPISCQQDYFFLSTLKCSVSFKGSFTAAWMLRSHLCNATFKLTAKREQPPPQLTPSSLPKPSISSLLLGLVGFHASSGRLCVPLRPPYTGEGKESSPVTISEHFLFISTGEKHLLGIQTGCKLGQCCWDVHHCNYREELQLASSPDERTQKKKK